MKTKKIFDKLYFHYEESSSGGETVAGQEGDAWPDYEDANTHFELLKCTLEKKENSFSTETLSLSFLPEKNEEVYVVLVRYSSGNTFGRHNGCWYLEGVYKEKEEANIIVKKILDKEYDGYVPWVGYFEYLESCDVIPMIVE